MSDPSETKPPSPGSWDFWRKRIARALIVGALALTAAQVLPALPEDQIVQVLPPEGSHLTRAQLVYFSAEDGEAIGGAELVPAEPAARLSHTVSLPNGKYSLSVSAQGTAADGTQQSYSTSQTVHLSGQTTRIHLKGSTGAP